jgi:hypothetical protein
VNPALGISYVGVNPRCPIAVAAAGARFTRQT